MDLVQTDNCFGDEAMVSSESRIARFLFYALTCALICTVFASELPEQLTLTNDTSNDCALRSPTILKTVQALTGVKLRLGPLVSSVPPQNRSQFPAVSNHGGSPKECDLSILLSVLRT